MAIETNVLRPQTLLFIRTFCQRGLFYHTAFVWVMASSAINLTRAWLQWHINIIFFSHFVHMSAFFVARHNQVFW